MREQFDVWAAAHPWQFAGLIYAMAFLMVAGVLAAVTVIVLGVFGVGVGWYHFAIVGVTAALSALPPAHDAYRQHPAITPTGGEGT